MIAMTMNMEINKTISRLISNLRRSCHTPHPCGVRYWGNKKIWKGSFSQRMRLWSPKTTFSVLYRDKGSNLSKSKREIYSVLKLIFPTLILFNARPTALKNGFLLWSRETHSLKTLIKWILHLQVTSTLRQFNKSIGSEPLRSNSHQRYALQAIHRTLHQSTMALLNSIIFNLQTLRCRVKLEVEFFSSLNRVVRKSLLRILLE